MFGVQYFLFHLTAVILLSQSTFVAATSCTCRCPKSKSQVCDIIEVLQTAEDVNREEWKKWNKYLYFVDRLHRDWEADVRHICEQVERDRKMNEIKDLEWMVRDVLDQFEKSQTRLKIETDARMVFEGKIKNFSAVLLTTEKRNSELQTNMSAIQAKLHETENLAKNLESELQSEKEARNSFEHQLQQHLTLTFGNQYQELQASISFVEAKLDAAEDLPKKLKSDIEKEIEAKKTFEKEVLQNNSRTISTIEKQNQKLQDLKTHLSSFEADLNATREEILRSESDREEEMESRKMFEEQMLMNYSTAISWTHEQNSEIRNTLSILEKRLLTAENLLQILDLNLRLERNSRETFEEDVIPEFSSRITTFEIKCEELQIDIADTKRRLQFVENQAGSSERRSEEAERRTREEIAINARFQEILKKLGKYLDFLV